MIEGGCRLLVLGQTVATDSGLSLFMPFARVNGDMSVF